MLKTVTIISPLGVRGFREGGAEYGWRGREGSREEVGLEEGQGDMSWAGTHYKPKQGE